MAINIVNRLMGYIPDDRNNVSITVGSYLHNPFKIGDSNVIDLTLIKDRADVLRAYEGYLRTCIEIQNPATIMGLNRIADIVLNQEEANLVCSCGSKHCHGYIIKKIVEEKIHEAEHISPAHG